ncbi:MAG: ABC transporter ATP-binding protein [Vicinamibacterales bacterium]
MGIAVEGLRRTYGSLTAVEDLTFRVDPGEIVGLIGPNGAGKTTTLRSLAGILRPTAGRVLVGGYDMATAPLDAKRLLAFMPDEPHLFEYMTVEEHFRLIGRLYGIADVDQRVRPLLDELELNGKQGALPGELSRGMRQKVVIACGLVRNPPVLLFDEPLTGLDPIGIRRMRDTILRRARDGAAVLLSSHLLPLVQELCNRVVIMHRGRKMADGTVQELAARVELHQADSTLEDIFLRVTGHDGPTGGGQ